VVQAVVTIESLPEDGVQAAAEFFRDHLGTVEQALSSEAGAVAVVLPSAPIDHDDWRRAVARDLARAHAPKRVNVIGTDNVVIRANLLKYTGEAPGITGQYLPGHE